MNEKFCPKIVMTHHLMLILGWCHVRPDTGHNLPLSSLQCTVCQLGGSYSLTCSVSKLEKRKRKTQTFYIYNINYIHTYPNICVYIQSFEKRDGEYERVGARCGVYNNVMLGPGQGWDMEDQPRYHHPPADLSNPPATSRHRVDTLPTLARSHPQHTDGAKLACSQCAVTWEFVEIDISNKFTSTASPFLLFSH